MKLLIEAGIFPEYQDHLILLAAKHKITHTLWDSKSYPPYQGKDNSVFFFGSILTARNLQNAKYQHQIWLNKEFDYFNLSGHVWPILNSEYVGMSFGNIANIIKRESGFGFDDNFEIFIKSNSGYKTIPGHLSTVNNFIKENIYQVFNEDVVIMAPKQQILKEYRMVVRCEPNDDSSDWSNSIVCSNLFMKNGQFVETNEEAPQEVIDKVVQILNASTYHPFPMFTLDVAIDSKDEVKPIEANSLNTSGLYGCNLESVLLNLKEILDEQVAQHSL